MDGHNRLVYRIETIINIEAAFFEGDIMIPTYVEFLEGLEELGFILPGGESTEYCTIQLLKSMYGNVVTALKFFRTCKKHLIDKKGCGWIQSKTDPCILYRRTQHGKMVLVAVAWVDDTVLVGLQQEIDQVKSEINK
jgi:hypothetical protein